MNLVKGTTVGAGVVAAAAFGYAQYFRLTGPALATAMKVAQVSGVIALVALAVWVVGSLVSKVWSSKPATSKETNHATDKTSTTWNQASNQREIVGPQDTAAGLGAAPAEEPAPQPKTGPASTAHTSEQRPLLPSPIPVGRTGFSNEAEMFQYGVKRHVDTLRRSLDDADQPSTTSTPVSSAPKNAVPPCDVSTPKESPEFQRSSGGDLESSGSASHPETTSSASTAALIVPQPAGTPSLPFSPTMATLDAVLPPATKLLPDTLVPSQVLLSAKSISASAATTVVANNSAASKALSNAVSSEKLSGHPSTGNSSEAPIDAPQKASSSAASQSSQEPSPPSPKPGTGNIKESIPPFPAPSLVDSVVAANNSAASETLSSDSPPIPTAHHNLTTPPTAPTSVEPIAPTAPDAPSAPSAPSAPGESAIPTEVPKKTGTWKKKKNTSSAAASSEASPSKPKTPMKTGGFNPSQAAKVILKTPDKKTDSQNKPKKTETPNPAAAALANLRKSPASAPAVATSSTAATTNSSPNKNRQSLTKKQRKALDAAVKAKTTKEDQ